MEGTGKLNGQTSIVPASASLPLFFLNLIYGLMVI